ncbi:MAG: hypothetical protein ACI8YQ_002166 [Polaribacter sp.]|jgi:hypothetical protein
MKKITICLLGVLFLATACNKDDDGSDNSYGLPNATEQGANTFGCLIDGEPWVAEVGWFECAVLSYWIMIQEYEV